MRRGTLTKTRLRRVLLGLALIAGLSALTSSKPSISAQDEDRTLSFYNIHTKETLSVVYKRDGNFIPEAMKKINHMMRDWRRDEPTKMDPELIDLIWELHTELGSQKPIHLISGYRSRKTNESLRRRRGGQARNSRHILGKAADIHFPDISAKQLRNSALVRERGGVGYYPTSAIPFVHVDTGRVRHWPRLPRYELAALFPSGRTKHKPRGGRRITLKDHKIAMSRLSEKQKRLVRIARGEVKPVRQQTQIASLDRNAIPNLLSKLETPKTEQPAKAHPEQNRLAVSQPPSEEKLEIKPEGRLILASANPIADLLAKKQQKPEPQITQSAEGWASAPAYDPEHPDELSYRPFPVLPLMIEKSVSFDTGLARLEHPDYRKIHLLMGEPADLLPMRFRPGLQFAEMLWASTFKGRAVPNLFTGNDEIALSTRKPQRRLRTAGR